MNIVIAASYFSECIDRLAELTPREWLIIVAVSALAAAVVLQAAEDYRAALERTRRTRGREGSKALAETERFFRSRWFTRLAGMDGRQVMERMRKEAGA